MAARASEAALRPLPALASDAVPRRDGKGSPARALDVEAEDELVLACARGDESALGRLYDRYAPLAYAIALRICGDRSDAEEAVGDAFLDLWRSARRFRRERGSLSTWLGVMARNRALDRWRRSARRRDGFPVREDDATADPDVAARVDARAALATLRPQQRAVLELAYFDGLTQREIAMRLGVPLGTVKSLTWRGLEALRAVLTDGD